MKRIPLNNNWHYLDHFDPSFIDTPLVSPEEIRLPHTNKELPYHYFDERSYQFVSSYEQFLTVEKQTDKQYYLHFEGVMTVATVYLNGIEVGSHKGGYTPFKIHVTDHLKNGENRLFVKVDSTERTDVPPFGFVVDYLTYGGIYREVTLLEKEANHIEDVFVHVERDLLHIDIHSIFTKGNLIEAKIAIKQDDTLIKSFDQRLDQETTQIVETCHLNTWDIDTPNMYTLEIYSGEVLLYQTRFAKRDIAFKVDGFYLNGERLKLRGLNRHQSYPYVGYAMPSSAQKRDADILKYDLGCTVVRSSHYPPSRHFLDRCDDIGLLVVTELPGWQHIGDDLWKEVAKENVREMIIRDRNHPSIILWGVRINESPDDDSFYQATNHIAHELDPTRPTGGVRNFKGSTLFEDVYTYNDFVHRGDNIGLEAPKKVAKQTAPYLVTEYNGHMYPTKPFDDEIHRINQVKRHLNVLEYAYRDPKISGAIGWCMFDYNTHKDFGSGDKICYHGVLDMFRNTKYAAHVYASQNDHEPILEIASNLQIGDFEASEIKEVIVLTNLDEVKFYINEDYIKTFKPSKEYTHLDHPPIIIDDFIGNLIHDNEPYSKKDADTIKAILLHIMKHGMNLPLRLKLKMAWVLFKNKLSIDEAAKLYEHYVGKWGLASLTYRFEGYKNGALVMTKQVGPSYSNHLSVTIDDNEIAETDTYEVTKMTVMHKDHNDNRLFYSALPVTLTIDGPLECIGPKTRPLRGGVTSFHVKTTGKKGLAKAIISTQEFPDERLEITVL
ncbi:MAG: glycoside hydrolase family 2 TIM barrel-domain containing protein [Candidatus Izemoplasma sp.]|nr:glycoside hydrolase family 2 TIM barrel-domain containing protein [Candidatus Izemoplasma sp.]